MSRTYRKKIKLGICYGNNTEYYRDRNRSTRNKNRQMLRNMLSHMTIEDVSDNIYNITNNLNREFNDWDEPTDGTWLLDKQYIQQRINRGEQKHPINKGGMWTIEGLKRKYISKLKSKHSYKTA